MVSETALIGAAYVSAAYLLSEIDPVVWLLYEDGMVKICLLAATLLVGMYFQDLYSDMRIKARFALFQQICLVLGMAFLFQALISYASPRLVTPRRIMILGSSILLLALPAWRIVYTALLLPVIAVDRLLFLGIGQVGRSIAERLISHPEIGMVPIGFVGDPAAGCPPLAAPVLGRLDEFRKIVSKERPDRIVVDLVERRQMMPVLDLLDVNFSGVEVEEVATTYEQVFQRVNIEYLRPSHLIFSRALGPRPGIVQLQTMYCWVIAMIVAVLTLPIMLLVALLVRLTSKGPVLYRQVRVGRNGALFTLYKFRSMRVDAEAATGAVWATKDDPRVTPLGKWLRLLRLDELPQVLNVLRGEMSIVGPRPERPEFVATLSEKIPFYRQRHCLRPGITGWAQINHKYGDTLEDTAMKLEYDLYYIKNLSPALDFYILFQTFKVMILTRGAQ